MLLCDARQLTAELFIFLHAQVRDGIVLPPDGVNLAEVERTLVIQALERTHGNLTKAAELLGLNRDQVRYRLDKFGLKI
jgi:transcriptional regulator with GAF, ATPase, and Fis domain